MKKILSLVLVAFVAVMVSGCAGGLPWKPMAYTTNSVPQVVMVPGSTNVVDVPELVDAAGNVTRAAGRVEVVSPAKLVTNWVEQVTVDVNPVWDKGIAGARSLNTKLNPTPTAPFVEWGLAALSAGLGWWARVATKRANGNRDMLNTVIAGVEEANNPQVKEAIATISRLRKNRAALQTVVEEQTA
ncbi:MAG TPA: hypothetical protein VGH19_16140 [Verrucomicrobiae bacterium]